MVRTKFSASALVVASGNPAEDLQSRENQKECLQYLAVGTTGAATPQGAGYGAEMDRAEG